MRLRALEARLLVPPYIPKVKNNLDVSHFDKFNETEDFVTDTELLGIDAAAQLGRDRAPSKQRA